jgi:hypothetical protein
MLHPLFLLLTPLTREVAPRPERQVHLLPLCHEGNALVVIAHRQRRALDESLTSLELGHLLGSHGNLGSFRHRHLHQRQIGIVRELLREPHEWLLEVVVRLGRNIVVLETLLAVEGDHLSLDLAVSTVYLVSYEHDRDVVAHAGNIAVPVRDVLVGVTARNVEHDDGALALNVVAIAQATKLLLTSGIPAVEADLTTVREEGERVHVHTDGGDVALLKLASQVALHESRLARTTIADKDQLEGGNAIRRRLLHFGFVV